MAILRLARAERGLGDALAVFAELVLQVGVGVDLVGDHGSHRHVGQRAAVVGGGGQVGGIGPGELVLLSVIA